MTSRWYRCTQCSQPTRINEGMRVSAIQCPFCGDRMEAVCVSSVSAKETAAFVGLARVSEADLAGDLCGELASGAKITGAIAEAMKDGRVMPDEATAMLRLIEARRDAEESLIMSLRAVAMKGKDHG
jgi:DNA-directed RNA polymerase subunit RPC12/RpoP